MIKTLKFKSNFLDNKILADIFFENLVYDWKLHSPICDRYKFYEDFFKSYYLPHQTKKISKLYIGKLGYFKFPYFKMGKISSYHLLGLDELIIFAFYKHLKNKKVKKVADLGANIGMHSLVLDRLGYKVKSFEPDIKHIQQFKKNMILNKTKNVNLIAKAVDVKDGKVEFTRLLNNTTSSFIKKSKKNYYGPAKTYKVESISFPKILKWADLIKMDVEGMEAELIETLTKKNMKNKTIIMEIGTKQNAIKIFKFSKKTSINIFAQKNNWQIVKKINEMPNSHKDGSVILSLSKINPWE